MERNAMMQRSLPQLNATPSYMVMIMDQLKQENQLDIIDIFLLSLSIFF
jgi:hypothetical protein